MKRNTDDDKRVRLWTELQNFQGDGERSGVERFVRDLERRGQLPEGVTAEAVTFFYVHDGYVVGNRLQSALDSAWAEAEKEKRGWRVEWSEDYNAAGVRRDMERDGIEVNEVFEARLFDQANTTLASLSAITDPGRDDYRIVEAELAGEALAERGVVPPPPPFGKPREPRIVRNASSKTERAVREGTFKFTSHYSKKLRERREAAGQCYDCSAPAEPGKKRCARCSRAMAEAARRYRLSRPGLSQSYNKKLRSRRAQEGLCSDCLAPSVPGRSRCQTCLDESAARSRKYRGSRSSSGRRASNPDETLRLLERETDMDDPESVLRTFIRALRSNNVDLALKMRVHAYATKSDIHEAWYRDRASVLPESYYAWDRTWSTMARALSTKDYPGPL